MSTFQTEICTVLAKQSLNPQTVILTLTGSRIAQEAKPGQFVQAACSRFLRRPLAVFDTDPAAGVWQTGIQVVGAGTRELADLQIGEKLDVLGPLGNGFQLDGWRQLILVSGGVGIFPLVFTLKEAIRRGIDTTVICGFTSPETAILTEFFQEKAGDCVFCSDVGGLDVTGHPGLALEPRLQQLAAAAGQEQTAVLTCGPRPMMAMVAKLCETYNISCQVSLEARMACGIGVCLVCTCGIKGHDNPTSLQNLRVCVDGPVFDGRDVLW